MALGKKMLLLAAFCGLAWGQTAFGQTALTTIQDTLFRADGTRFYGTLLIHWNTFDTTNPGTVLQQSTTVTVVNGNLQVSLIPNAAATPPANLYTVQYQSDGREQFGETWSVPVSTLPLRVSQVRTGTLAPSNAGIINAGQSGTSTTVTESSVIGLQADLAQRPIKGAGFGTDAVAVINDNGQIETVVGDVGDCVYVDGTAGPCGQPTFADAETPGGIVDGTNNTLTLANTPLGSSLLLFRNGLYMTPNFDYTLTGSTVQFVPGAVPRPGDTLTASYRVDTSAGGNIALVTTGTSSLHTAAAQVICSAAGAGTASTSWTTLGACDIPAAGLNAGDRIEVRFTFSHTGSASGFNLQLNWGSTTILARGAASQDSAVTGRAEAGIATTGAQISTESWGTVLPFLPGILASPSQAGLQVNFRAALASAGSDSVSLTNYTVLRYPGN